MWLLSLNFPLNFPLDFPLLRLGDPQRPDGGI
jgi:hypothetical protein